MEPGCPECGGEPTEDSALEVRMESLGYASGASYECSECGNTWV